MPEFFCPLVSLAPLSFISPDRAMEMIAKAGFDGAQVLLGPRTDRSSMRALAGSHGLKVEWHEMWTLEESSNHLHNRVAACLRMLPLTRSERIHLLPSKDEEPVVCYPDTYDEYLKRGLSWELNFRLQTCSTLVQRMGYVEFVRCVRLHGLGVVLDTQHALEWLTGNKAGSVDQLCHYTGAQLHEKLLQAWTDLRRYVKQIHFNTFIPEWGHTLGGNLFPDAGVLNLRAFAERVMRDGWNGTVVPEVNPAWLSTLALPRLFPLGLYPSLEKLKKLNETVRSFFTP